MELIDKSAIVAEIKRIEEQNPHMQYGDMFVNRDRSIRCNLLEDLLDFINTLEVKDPYEQCVQHDSIEAGIQSHAKTYSFNIESVLFPQLTKEQQTLWRKEIEQACISGGDVGVELSRDPRYKENIEVKEVDLDIKQRMEECPYRRVGCTMYEGKILECKGACSWVVDYPKLKKLKTKKGE